MSHFLILSLKHSTGNEPTFWKPDNSGYTINPYAAGVYTQAQVEADLPYYNDGSNTLAVPLTTQGLENMGFKCTMDVAKVKELATAARKQYLARKEAANG